MKRELTVLIRLTVIAGVASVSAQDQDPTPPAWAYPTNPPALAGGGAQATTPAPDTTPLHLPGTNLTFTRAQIRNGFDPSDWRPETPPTMPEVVANGRQPEVRACALCHYPNGQGRPENGPVAGLPAAYIIQQLKDFKSGARKSSEPRMGPPAAMVRLAQAMPPEAMATSAAYFASFPYQKWIRVVEATTVPKTRVAGSMWVPAAGPDPDPDAPPVADPDAGPVADPDAPGANTFSQWQYVQKKENGNCVDSPIYKIADIGNDNYTLRAEGGRVDGPNVSGANLRHVHVNWDDSKAFYLPNEPVLVWNGDAWEQQTVPQNGYTDVDRKNIRGRVVVGGQWQAPFYGHLGRGVAEPLVVGDGGANDFLLDEVYPLASWNV